MVKDKLYNTYETYQMEITDLDEDYYSIRISTNEFSTFIKYHPGIKELKLANNNSLDKILLENKYQLRKILNNKRTDTFYRGFTLKFVLKNNNEIIEFNDLSRIIVL